MPNLDHKLATRGFKYAISSMGSYKYIKPFTSTSQTTKFTITGILPVIFVTTDDVEGYRYKYEISIFNYKQDRPSKIDKENLCFYYTDSRELALSINRSSKGNIIIKGKEKEDILTKRIMTLPLQVSILETPFTMHLFAFKVFLGEQVQYFDFITKTIRSPAVVSSPDYLESDGANLAKIINRILTNQK